jgi:hypothetical protein
VVLPPHLPPHLAAILQFTAILVNLTYNIVMDRFAALYLRTPDASEDESDHEEIDHPGVDDDYEGNFYIIDGYTPCKLRTQQHVLWQNASSREKLREHHHQSPPQRPRGLESSAGSRADCGTCYRCPLTFYSW